MNELIVIGGLIVVVVWLMRPFRKGRALWRDPKSQPAEGWEFSAYESRANIFVGKAEPALFDILRAELPSGFHVFAKVRLEDILKPQERYRGTQDFWRLRGRVKSRHIDFVVCRQNGEFVCAIELDGYSHQDPQARMVDAFKDQIFQHANLPLYRLQVGDDFREFSRKLHRKLT